jgi:bifunctional non-homologous end joining protein LigD
MSPKKSKAKKSKAPKAKAGKAGVAKARKASTTRSALDRYQAKRDFNKTAEPRGKAPHQSSASGGLRYLIQKHAARRLHYDFRLELDGTLKSWAVTKGPSLDPADKRLAVHVEDHPLEYGSFEGTIPQGQYGGGTVMLWDEGTWEPIGDAAASYKKGRLTFILNGERLKGEWHLVRMGGRASAGGKHDNWLLIKSRDQYANEKNGDQALEKFTTSAVSDRSMEAIAKGNKQWKSKAAVKKAPDKTKEPTRRTPKRKASKASGAGTAPPAFIEPELATWSASRPRARSGCMRSSSMAIAPCAASPAGPSIF